MQLLGKEELRLIARMRAVLVVVVVCIFWPSVAVTFWPLGSWLMMTFLSLIGCGDLLLMIIMLVARFFSWCRFLVAAGGGLHIGYMVTICGLSIVGL